MGSIKGFYNKNRKKVWRIIIIIAFAFALLQLANGIAKDNNRKKLEQSQIKIQENLNKKVEKSNNNVSKAETNSDIYISTIEQFMDFCNNKQLDKAYEMLTDKCKEQMFNNIETFERIYYSSAFENRKKEYSVEKWINNTYMIKINESSLALGKVSKDNQKIDYITPVKDKDGNYKLNINNYIGYEELKAVKEQDNIKYEVTGRNVYMNFEEYTIKVSNNSNSDIKLDPLDNTNSLYIQDNNGSTYPAYKHELTEEMMTIGRGHTREISIKFYSSYLSSKSTAYIVFGQTQDSNKFAEVKIDL